MSTLPPPPCTRPSRPPEPRAPGWLRGESFFVAWYGDPAAAPREAARVRDARPAFVVVGAGLHARPEVPAFFRAGAVRTVAYVATAWGRRDASDVAREAACAGASGYDGVFFDEIDPAADGFNRAAAAAARAGSDRIVVMNTGRAAVPDALFDVADVVSVENQWDRALSPAGLPPWRWMAVQGDPAALAAPSLDVALARLAAFRAAGGGWYYSGPWAPEGSTHWRLADWLEDFAAAARALPPP